MGSPEEKICKEGKKWQIKLMRKGRIMRKKKGKALKQYKRNNKESRIGKQAKAIPANPVSVPVRKKQASKQTKSKEAIHKFWIKWSRKTKKLKETDSVHREKRKDKYYQGLEAFQ